MHLAVFEACFGLLASNVFEMYWYWPEAKYICIWLCFAGRRPQAPAPYFPSTSRII